MAGTYQTWGFLWDLKPSIKKPATLSLVKFEDLDSRRLRNTPVLYTIEAIPLSVFPLAGVLIPGQNLLRRCLNKQKSKFPGGSQTLSC